MPLSHFVLLGLAAGKQIEAEIVPATAGQTLGTLL